MRASIGSKSKPYNYDTTPLDGQLKPTRDLMLVRELPVEQTGLIVAPTDPNRSATWLWGIVEAVGPKVVDCRVGDKVLFPAGSGEFRVPGDDDVIIMSEDDVVGVHCD